MIKLYHAHISTCSQKVRLCLAEKALDWESHVMNFAVRDQLKAEYLAINPNGVVPTLVHNGSPVIDSSVICEYLEESFPESGTQLMPDAPIEKAKVRAWLRYIEEVPTVAIRYPSFNILFKDHFLSGTKEQREEHANKLPLRKDFYKKFNNDGFSDDEIEASKARLRQCLERMERALDLNQWVVSDQFSLADICLTPTIVRMEDLGLSNLFADLPGVVKWYERIKQRNSFDLAYYAGTRSDPADTKILER